MKQVGYRHVTGKLYPGMRHEILNEKNKLTVFKIFINIWKNKVIILKLSPTCRLKNKKIML